MGQPGSAHEELASLGRCAIQDFPGEVGEDRIAIAQIGRVALHPMVQHEGHPTDPPVCHVMQALSVDPRIRPASASDRVRLLGREPKRIPFDQGKAPVQPRPREQLRQVLPAEQDQRGLRRHLLDCRAEELVEHVIRRDFLVVVEDQGCARRQSREQLAEETSGEAFHIGEILGGEQRQRALPWPGQRSRRFSQVVEQRGYVGVTRIDLIPDALDAPCIQPARDQGSLAGASRADDADRRVVCNSLIKEREYPLTGHGAMQPWPRELGELRPPPRHPSPCLSRNQVAPRPNGGNLRAS